MIELKDVCRSFEHNGTMLHVLQDLTWHIEKGQSIALMGRSGSGKSTLLNVLGCLDRGYTGSLQIDGQETKKLSDKELAHFRNQKIGMVFQSFHLMDQLNCLDNVLLPTWFSSDKTASLEYAKELLERVGLKDKYKQKPTRLSGGEKQRVAIARALVMKPEILLCDEPTGNLDEETREDILQLFQEIHKEYNVTLLLVTHERQTASIADAIFHLRKGQIHPEQNVELHSSEGSSKRGTDSVDEGASSAPDASSPTSGAE